MVGMRWLNWVVALLLLTTQAAGQTSADNLVDFFISEGFSIYNGLTSALGSAASAASAAASSSSDAAASVSASPTDAASPTATNTAIGIGTTARPSSASSRSNDASSTFRSSLRTPGSSASSTDASGSSASTEAAAASGSAAAASSSHGGGGGNNNLPIILGCVLGALALGLFILALLLCCKRRRRHRSESAGSRALSPDDHEVASWAQPGIRHHRHHRSNKEFLAGAGAGAAPLMSEHPAFRNHHEHENPFVPVPPPPRRSAPNSRTGLTDGMVPGDHPYLTDSDTGHPIGRKSGESSHTGRNVAMGAGAAALGAAALHHHNKSKDEGVEVNNPYNPHRSSGISRKPVPVNDNINRGSWAAPSPTANDDAFAMNKPGGRRSIDSARSRASRDAARANAAFDNQYAPISAHGQDHGLHHDNDHHRMGTTAALGAGALGGAALAHHHHKRSRSHSRSLSRSRSPHRRSLLAAKKHDSDNSNTSSDFSNISNSKEYANAVPHQHSMSGGVGGNEMANPILDAPSHDPPYGVLSPINVPPAPQTRSRRNSPLGTAAPAAATLSYVDSDHHRDRDRSTSRPRTYPYPYPNTPDDFNRGREMSGGWATPPAPGLPPGSPRRSSYRQSAEYSRGQGNDYEAFPTVMPGPLSSNVHSAMNPYPSPQLQVHDRMHYQEQYTQNEYPQGRYPQDRYTQDQHPQNEYQEPRPQDPFPQEPFPQTAPHPLSQQADGVSTPGLENLHTSTGIVGDSRYPHLNIPRRKSGGEYDLANDESYLPKGVPDGRSRSRSGSMSASRDASRNASRSGSRKNSMNISVSGARPPLIGGRGSGNGTGSGYESEDSTWRLSNGMPGGWASRRNRSESPRRSRKSGEVGRSPLVSPMSPNDGTGAGGGAGPSAGNGGWGSLGWERDRDSLVSGSTAVGSGGNSGTGTAALRNVGAGTGRLSLADLRRQEEEMMRLRGRQSMQAEWVGYDGGYDGYGGGGVGPVGSGSGRESRYYADQGVGVAR